MLQDIHVLLERTPVMGALFPGPPQSPGQATSFLKRQKQLLRRKMRACGKEHGVWRTHMMYV